MNVRASELSHREMYNILLSAAMRPIRSRGMQYARTTDRFEMVRPKVG